MLSALSSHNIRIIIVFEGVSLPLRKNTLPCVERETITFLTNELHKRSIDVIVAPYETAAELAFINMRGKFTQ